MTKTYGLYVESGPKQKKTMVHVLELLGCVATGPTTAEALEATPAAIRAYLRFLERHGSETAPGAPFETQIAEHVMEGGWLGNGSPYLVFAPDLEPIGGKELEVCIERFTWMQGELADWVARQSDAQLDAKPGTGRAPRAIVLHVLGPAGSYLSGALGSAPGFSRLASAAERGEIAPADALRQSAAMAAARLRASTPEERTAIRENPKNVRTLRKSVRRMLEHSWEHLAELSRRQGGPVV